MPYAPCIPGLLSPVETLPRFPGSNVTTADQPRLVRQHERIRDLMLDGRWRTLSEIAASTGDHEASVSAQLRHLRKASFGGYAVGKRRRGKPQSGLWEYLVRGGQ